MFKIRSLSLCWIEIWDCNNRNFHFLTYFSFLPIFWEDVMSKMFLCYFKNVCLRPLHTAWPYEQYFTLNVLFYFILHKWTDEQINKWTKEQMNTLTYEKMNKCTNEHTYIWTNAQTNKSTNEQMNTLTYEHINTWTNAQMNKKQLFHYPLD